MGPACMTASGWPSTTRPPATSGSWLRGRRCTRTRLCSKLDASTSAPCFRWGGQSHHTRLFCGAALLFLRGSARRVKMMMLLLWLLTYQIIIGRNKKVNRRVVAIFSSWFFICLKYFKYEWKFVWKSLSYMLKKTTCVELSIWSRNRIASLHQIMPLLAATLVY
jgi:hypothetical protein